MKDHLKTCPCCPLLRRVWYGRVPGTAPGTEGALCAPSSGSPSPSLVMNCLSKGLSQGSSTALWLQFVELASLLGTTEPGDKHRAEEEASREGLKWCADVREMLPVFLYKEQFFLNPRTSKGEEEHECFGLDALLTQYCLLKFGKRLYLFLGSLKLSLNFDSCVFKRGYRKTYSGFGRVFMLIINWKC